MLGLCRVMSSVDCAQGWRWVNEGKSPLRPKWGYVTEELGNSLLVQVRICAFRHRPPEKRCMLIDRLLHCNHITT